MALSRYDVGTPPRPVRLGMVFDVPTALRPSVTMCGVVDVTRFMTRIS